ncbi:YecA family protein [Caulobacter sp. CCUG 60055]|nr:YecA family protein [Caulobacter sp. CCUG 60055]
MIRGTHPAAAERLYRGERLRQQDPIDIARRAAMSSLSPRLKALERELDALGGEAMTLSELDGLLTGLIVCPDLIMPHEWLPLVWGDEEDGEELIFDSQNQVQALMGSVMAHYNAIADTLSRCPAKYRPILEIDECNGDVLWEVWADGFNQAMALRPGAWTEILSDDNHVSLALGMMVILTDIANGDSDLPEAEIEKFTLHAPAVIPELVQALNARRLQRRGDPAPSPARPAKADRNEPCSCGSGKKYKKCCGLN